MIAGAIPAVDTIGIVPIPPIDYGANKGRDRMSMSRKDYEMVADILGGVWGQVEGEIHVGARPSSDAVAELAAAMNLIMDRLSFRLECENPRFDRGRFGSFVRDRRDHSFDLTVASVRDDDPVYR